VVKAFTCTCPVTYLNDKIVRSILHEYKIFNAEIVVRCDATVDEFIDVVEGRRAYVRCLYVYNKIDQLSIEEVDKLARSEYSCVISCNLDLNLETLVEKIWEYLNLVRVYTKRRGVAPDFRDPMIMRQGATIEHVCRSLHKDLVEQFKYALAWGRSAKHTPQRVGISHLLSDEDVVQIVKK